MKVTSRPGQGYRKKVLDHNKIPERKYPHDFGILPGMLLSAHS